MIQCLSFPRPSTYRNMTEFFRAVRGKWRKNSRGLHSLHRGMFTVPTRRAEQSAQQGFTRCILPCCILQMLHAAGSRFSFECVWCLFWYLSLFIIAYCSVTLHTLRTTHNFPDDQDVAEVLVDSESLLFS